MKIVRWIGLGVGVLVALAAMLIAGGYLLGSRNWARTYDVQTAQLVIPTDSAAIARGAHLSQIHGCTDCHARDLSGMVFEDAPPFRLVASNLTRGAGGVGSTYTAEDFDRAFRHGVRPDGTALFIMPAAAYHDMSDPDAADLIAYLHQVPPVDNVLPERKVKPLGRILAAVALDPSIEVNPAPTRATSPPAGPTAEYGRYLTSITCDYCHGAELVGAIPPIPGSPPAPGLAAAGRWSFEEFQRALRTGMRPSGVAMEPNFMPWAITAQMSDDELRAIHSYLGSLANQPSGAGAQPGG